MLRLSHLSVIKAHRRRPFSTWGRWHFLWKERGQLSHITRSPSLLQMQHSSSFFWFLCQDKHDGTADYTVTCYMHPTEKGFLLCRISSWEKWDHLMSLKTRPSCCFMKDGAEWGHCLMNKLTWSSSSGLHRLQLHSREWIVRVSAWNRQGGLLFLQSIVIRSF